MTMFSAVIMTSHCESSLGSCDVYSWQFTSLLRIVSDVNKDLGLKAKDSDPKAKDLSHKAKDLGRKAKAKDSRYQVQILDRSSPYIIFFIVKRCVSVSMFAYYILSVYE